MSRPTSDQPSVSIPDHRRDTVRWAGHCAGQRIQKTSPSTGSCRLVFLILLIIRLKDEERRMADYPVFSRSLVETAARLQTDYGLHQRSRIISTHLLLGCVGCVNGSDLWVGHQPANHRLIAGWLLADWWNLIHIFIKHFPFSLSDEWDSTSRNSPMIRSLPTGFFSVGLSLVSCLWEPDDREEESRKIERITPVLWLNRFKDLQMRLSEPQTGHGWSLLGFVRARTRSAPDKRIEGVFFHSGFFDLGFAQEISGLANPMCGDFFGPHTNDRTRRLMPPVIDWKRHSMIFWFTIDRAGC